MKQMLTDDSSIGGYMTLWVRENHWQVTHCSSESVAAFTAQRIAQANAGSRVYIAKIEREFFGSTVVTELKAK